MTHKNREEEPQHPEGTTGLGSLPPFSWRTKALLRGFVELLRMHGMSDDLLTQACRQIGHYLDINATEALWLKRAKYLLTYPMAVLLQQKDQVSLPKEGPFVPTGGLRRWMMCRLHVFNKSNTHLWYSWLQLKRCAEPLSVELIEDNYREHWNQLSSKDPLSTEEANDLIDQNPVFAELLQTIKKELGKGWSDDLYEASTVTMAASTSACYEATRNTGGQSGHLYREAFGGSWSKEDNLQLPTDAYSEYLLYRMDYRLQSHGWSVIELRAQAKKLDVDESVRRLRNGMESRFISPWTDLHWKLNSGGVQYACIQAVLEPFKVRIISKGPSKPYYMAHGLQKRLHTILRAIPCFRLIGEPINKEMIEELGRKARPGEEWFSVDYSAATDKLSSNLGLAILGRILPESRYNEVFARVLGKHRLVYPQVDDRLAEEPIPEEKKEWRKAGKPIALPNGQEGTEMGDQQNGQLMGSILSFPILCLANLLVFCETMRVCHVKKDIDAVLVNGDDMLYTALPQCWEHHVDVGHSVGLVMSPGKAYMHPVYCNANSTSFLFNLRAPQGQRCAQVPFFNAGLFFGQHKVQGGTDLAASHHEYESGICVNLQTILDGVRPGPGHASRLLSRLLKKYKTEIAEETSIWYRSLRSNGRPAKRTVAHRALFVSKDLGGMGIKKPIGFKSRVNRVQRAIAYSILNNLEGQFVRVVPQGCLEEEDNWLLQNMKQLKKYAGNPWTGACPAETDRPTITSSCPLTQTALRRWFPDLESSVGFFLIPRNPSVISYEN